MALIRYTFLIICLFIISGCLPIETFQIINNTDSPVEITGRASSTMVLAPKSHIKFETGSDLFKWKTDARGRRTSYLEIKTDETVFVYDLFFGDKIPVEWKKFPNVRSYVLSLERDRSLVVHLNIEDVNASQAVITLTPSGEQPNGDNPMGDKPMVSGRELQQQQN